MSGDRRPGSRTTCSVGLLANRYAYSERAAERAGTLPGLAEAMQFREATLWPQIQAKRRSGSRRTNS